MAIATPTHGTASNYLQRAPSPSGLAEVLSVILDKGIVIDAYVRVSLVGIELLTVDARIVVASVDTYLRFAEAVNRLDIQSQSPEMTLPDLISELQEGGASKKTKGALEGVKEKLFGDDDEDEEDEDKPKRRTRTRASSSSGSSRSRSGSGSGSGNGRRKSS